MNPPVLAQALVALAAPTSDYEIIAGDLHEEYSRITHFSGVQAANRWYWTQALLSMPSLVSYSRSDRSTLGFIGVALISLVVLFAMLVVVTVIESILQSFGFSHIPHYIALSVNYADAIVFGAILARLVRIDGLRVAFFASLFLVLCFVFPALAGNPHSQAPLTTWIQVCGAIPAMSIGAGFYQITRYGLTA